MSQREAILRRATAADRLAVKQLLTALELPTAGVTEWLDEFWVADDNGAIVGVAGVERYGASGLLRSVAVDPAWRGRGLARKLTAHAIDAARTSGIDDIYLLTTTAEDYFPRLGFEPIARDAVPAGVRESVEFKGACPASAAAMRLGKGRTGA